MAIVLSLLGVGVFKNVEASWQKDDYPGGLLILKTDRTGSSWLCEELNKRGVHVSQESLLFWGREAQKRGVDPEPYLNSSGRYEWVKQSLLRSMPKNPFSASAACKPASDTAFGHPTYTQSKRDICTSQTWNCEPPYNDSLLCNDRHGCFVQDTFQAQCFHENRDPKVVGISYAYRELLTKSDGLNFVQAYVTDNEEYTDGNVATSYPADEEEFLEWIKSLKGFEMINAPELNPLDKSPGWLSETFIKQYPIYHQILKEVRDTGRKVSVLAQTRSNIVRWRISQAFLYAQVGHQQSKLWTQIKVGEDKYKLEFHDAATFFTAEGGAERALVAMKFTQMADDDSANVILYEDLAKDIDKSIDAILAPFGGVETAGLISMASYKLCTFLNKNWTTEALDHNTKNQHTAVSVKHYMTNFREVKRMLKPYPCLYRQLTDSTKLTTWTLPVTINAHTGALEIDHSKDCCPLDNTTFTRVIKDYLQASLDCSANSVSPLTTNEVPRV